MAINEYEQILESGAPAVATTEYDQALQQDAATAKSALQQSMFVAAKAEPDHQAKVMQLARETNLPPEMVARNFEAINTKAQESKTDYDGLIEQSPQLAAWLENPNNAAVAKDDIDAQKKIEKTVQDYGMMEAIGSDLFSGLNSAGARLSKIPGFFVDTVIRRKTMGLFSAEDLGVENRPAKYLSENAKKYATPFQQIDVLKVAGEGDYALAGKGAASIIVSSLPTTASVIAASFLGGPAAGAIVAGGGTAAEKLEESLAKGIDYRTALGNAFATGAIEAGVESLPFGTIGALRKQATALTARYGTSVTREVMKEAFTQIGKSVVQEGTEEAITSVAQDWTDYVMGVNEDAIEGILGRAGNAFVVGAGSGGLMTGPAAVGAGVSRSREIRKANMAREFYTAIGTSVESTKLRTRLPDAQREVVEQIVKGTGVENVYIPVAAMESYFQDKKISPVAIAQELDVVAAFEDAKATGGDVKIPLATWTNKIVGTEHYQGLQNDIKFDPEALTVNENGAIEAATKADLEVAQAEATAQQEQRAQDESAKQVAAQVSEMLTATGQYTPAEVKQFSSLFEQRYAARAENRGLGESALDLFNRQNLDFQSAETAQPFDMQMAAQTQEQSFEQRSQEVDQVVTPEFMDSPTQDATLPALPPQAAAAIGGEGMPVLLKKNIVEKVAAKRGVKGTDAYLAPEERLRILKDALYRPDLAIQDDPSKPDRWLLVRRAEGTNDLVAVDVVAVNGQIEPVTFYPPGDKELARKMKRAEKNGGKQIEISARQEDAKSLITNGIAEGAASLSALQPGQTSIPDGQSFDQSGQVLRNRKKSKPSPLKQELEATLGKELGIEFEEGGDYIREVDHGNYSDGLSGGQAKRAKNLGFDINHTWYHGSRANIESFSSDTLGGSTGAGSARLAHFFASSPETASDYAEASSDALSLRSSRTEAEATKAKAAFNAAMKEKYGKGWVSKLTAEEKSQRAEINKQFAQSIEDFNRSQEAQKHKIERREYDLEQAENNVKFLESEIKKKAYAKKAKDLQASIASLTAQVTNTDWVENGGAYNIIDKSTGERLINKALADKEGDSKYRFYSPGPEYVREQITRMESRLPELTAEAYKVSLKEAKESLAEMRAEHLKVLEGAEGQTVYRTVLKMTNPLIVDFKGAEYREVTYREILEKAQAAGHDGVIFKNTYDPAFIGSMAKEPELMDVAAVFDATHIRSVNAAFDPSLADSPNILDQSGEATSPRGRILLGKNEKIIQLFNGSDLSTVLHESGHLWLEELIEDATTEGVNPNLAKDLDTILAWMGVEARAKDGFQAVKAAVQTEQHELFARGAEAYFMEGKAPSPALRKAFARFKLWLTRIYQKVSALDVELTDDVRSVFDRMLVSEQAMKEANAELAYDPLFADPKAMGMNDTTAARYLKALDEANQSATDRLTARLMEDVAKKNRAKYKEEAAKVQAQVEAEVAGDQRYVALGILQKGELPDGSPLKLDRAALVEEYGPAFLKQLPRPLVYTNEGGISHRVAAEMLGFESGDQLLTTMANLTPLKEYIPAEVKRRMQEAYPDLTDPTAIRETAKALAHTEDRAKVLRMELEHLASNNLPVLKDAIRRVTKRLPTEAALRRQAEQMVGRQKMGEIRPKAYQAAAVRSAKEAGAFLAKGDIDNAFESKRKELLNLELFRAAEKAQEQSKKAIERFKKFRGLDADLARSRDMDLVNAGRAILQKYSLGRAEKTAEEYLAPMKQYDPEMYANVSEIVNGAVQSAAPYKQVSFDDFQAMADIVDSIWELSKSSREMEIEGKKVDREVVKAEISARLQEMGEGGTLPGTSEALTPAEKRTKGLRNLVNLVTRVEGWARAMDKGEFGGPFTKYLVRPIMEATARYRLAKVDALVQLRDIVQGIDIEDPALKIDAPEIGYKFTKPELLMAMLHSGNDSNKKKLLLGRGWGEVLPDGSLDTSRWDSMMLRMQRTGVVTKSDWDAVQKIWDLNESLKPGAQKAHKKMYGFYFNEITANSFETPFGEYKGGYMPAIADQDISMDANIRAGQTLEDNPGQMFPTTGRGFTKSREDNYSTPLSLDFSKVQNHIDKVLKFTHIEPAVKDAARLVNDRGLRQELNAQSSEVANDLLLPWLKRAATQKATTPGFSATFDRGISWFRRTTSQQFMVLNVVNSIQNLTGFLPAMTQVGKKELAGAFKRYMADPRGYSQQVQEASVYMRTRIGDNASEVMKGIDEVILNPTKFQQLRESAVTHGYILDRMTNGLVEVTVWGGAYNEGLAKGLSHEDAVANADAIVRQSLAAMNPEDIARFETGSPMVRLFTMFSGFFNTQANLLKTELAIASEEGLTTKEGGLRAARAYTYVVALPAIVSAIIMRVMAGAGLDEDDDGEYFDDFLDTLFGSQFRYLMAFAPGGNIVNSVVNRFNAKPYDDKISISPAISNLEKSLGAVVSVPSVVAGGSVSKAIKEGLPALGLVTGLPAAPLAKPLGYAAEVAEGKAKPTGPIDFTRGLMTGRRGKE